MEYASNKGRLFIRDTSGCVWSDALRDYVPIEPNATDEMSPAGDKLYTTCTLEWIDVGDVEWTWETEE